MRAVLSLLSAVALSGCNSSPKLWTHDEIVDIADDAQDDSELQSSVADLDSRLSALEAENSRLKRQVSDLEAETGTLRLKVGY